MILYLYRICPSIALFFGCTEHSRFVSGQVAKTKQHRRRKEDRVRQEDRGEKGQKCFATKIVCEHGRQFAISFASKDAQVGRGNSISATTDRREASRRKGPISFTSKDRDAGRESPIAFASEEHAEREIQISFAQKNVRSQATRVEGKQKRKVFPELDLDHYLYNGHFNH